MINVGDIVSCRTTGNQAWVVRAKHPGGGFWLLITKGTDARNRSTYFGRQARENDLQTITPRPYFSPGATIEHEGLTCSVISDDGDFVTLDVPMHSARLRGGGTLRITPGIVEVSKSDLVLAELN